MSTGTIVTPAQTITLSDGSTIAVGSGSQSVLYTSSSPPPPTQKVIRSGAHLTLGGNPFRAIGYDMFSVATPSWWTPACGTNGVEADFDGYLTSLKAVSPHLNAVRIFIISQDSLHNGVRDWSAIDACLATAAAHGVRIFWTLEDFWDYERSGSQGTGLNGNPSAFFNGGWKTTALPATGETYQSWVTAAVSRYHDNPSVLAWEMMNEPSGMPVQFASDVSALIRKYDTTTPICSGGQGSQETAIAALANIDFLVYHYYTIYNQTDYASTANQALVAGKPWIMSEYGVTSAGQTRANQVHTDLTAFFNTTCSGLLYWAWAAVGGYNLTIGSTSDPSVAVIDSFGL